MTINDWISVSPDNGCGEKTVTITLDKNETGSDRTYQIPVYFDDGSIKYITVNQPACGDTPTPSPICDDALVWGTYKSSTLTGSTAYMRINLAQYTPTVDGSDWALCNYTGGTITYLDSFMDNNDYSKPKKYLSVYFSDTFDTSEVKEMSAMFFYCSALTNLDVSSFNTSKVTRMDNMFYGCSGLTSLDVSNFNTSNVTNMSHMFRECSGLTSINLSNFDTSKVTSMVSMFYDSSGLVSLDLSNFDTSNVTSMGSMFGKCDNLTTVDVSNSDSVTQQKLLAQVQTDLPDYTWVLSNGIIQRKNGSTGCATYATASQRSFRFPLSGGTATFTVESDGGYYLTLGDVSDRGITITPTGDQLAGTTTFTITCEAGIYCSISFGIRVSNPLDCGDTLLQDSTYFTLTRSS